MSRSAAKNKSHAAAISQRGGARQIAAGEFKAKCLGLIDEVNETGQALIITKRGKPLAKVIPFEHATVDSLFGRLKGIVEIVGDPDDLIKPVFPLEDFDMLK
ncbi:MAG TPA: type II toxin-antitoxin system prevent-host-death family antitoxin [Terriglobales bacterium]|jgi:prevent-host-death family protein